MQFEETPEEIPELQMGPMIDCVFLLLLYFISAAQIKLEEKYLSLMVPGQAAGVPESLPTEVELMISDEGNVYFNSEPIGGPDDAELLMLRGKLESCLALFGDKQPVKIQPQPKVRQQRVVDVVNACAAVGVKNLSFMANQ